MSRIMGRAAGRVGLLALAALGACSGGTTGTVQLTLATAPGSTVLDAVQTLRMTLTSPRQVVEAARTSAGFDLSIEVDATAQNSAVIVEGLDAAGTLVACGQSPAFPVGAINAGITVYVAAPRSIALAPVSLAGPRSEVAGTALAYGGVLAGGRDASGTPTNEIGVYNAYVHTFVAGIAMPAPRAGLAMANDGTGLVYLFGGTGADGKPTGTLWQFNTTVAPNGAFSVIDDQPQLARTGQQMVLLTTTSFEITGTPGLTTAASSAITGVTVVADVPALPAPVASGAATYTFFAGDPIVRQHASAFDTLPITGRGNAALTTLPDRRVAVVGGGDPLSPDAIVIDSADGTLTTVTGALQTPRARPSIATTSRYVVVAGGTDASGALVATAEVLDATTLAPVATLPIIARTGAYLLALPTDQVLIAGGAPASAAIELFTPDPPAL